MWDQVDDGASGEVEAVVSYQKGSDHYNVYLTFRDQEGFEDMDRRLINNPQAYDKQGEELIALIMEMESHHVETVSRFKNGRLNDGPNGEIAQVSFYDNGTLRDSAHYLKGKLNDKDGEAALKLYDQLGQLTHEDHYKDGVKTSAADVPTAKPAPKNKQYRPWM